MTVTLPPAAAFIDGSWILTGEPFSSENPATASEVCTLPTTTQLDVRRAVQAARDAFDGEWRRWSLGRRQRVLENLADLLDHHRSDFAQLESMENGVPIGLVERFSVAAMVKNFRYFASWIDKFGGEVVPLTSGNALDYVVPEPYGTVAVLTAYNTPSLFLGSKVAPALAAGNTVVVKPSPLASLTALRLCELGDEAGLPRGVLNVVLGGAEVGAALVGDPDIDRISFTGSREAGRAVSRAAAEHLTPVSLELGGKSPNIVFGDADPDRIGMGAAIGAFALSGQACVAGTRLFVESSVLDETIARVVDATSALRVGDPTLRETVLGPLISAGHRQRVEHAIEIACDQGAEILCGGDRPASGSVPSGYFLNPTLLIGAADTSGLVRDELFGPVVAVLPFESESEVVTRANSTQYGLAAGVWTSDVGRAHRIARSLRAGTVWVNSYGVVPHTAPFGGFKQSGHGREGGRWAMDLYTQPKNVYVDLS